MATEPNAPVAPAPFIILPPGVGCVTPEDFAHMSEAVKASTGLTKREYFAAKAMQGIIAGTASDGCRWGDVAAGAVRMADALIAELNK